MNKQKTYRNTRFGAEILKDALELIRLSAEKSDTPLKFGSLKIEHDHTMWNHDSFDEFLSDYRKFQNYFSLDAYGNSFALSIWSQSKNDTVVDIKATSRSEIEVVFEVFERAKVTSALPPPTIAKQKPVIFIGHGRSAHWRELKDHLQDKHGFRIETYEAGARAGHTIRDILEDMVSKTSFAVLVLTAEDEQADGLLRARQNVIHEAGLFQGRLGFARAVLLLENGVEEFSNVQGIQYIPFSKGNIKEAFGEVLATIKREFYPEG